MRSQPGSIKTNAKAALADPVLKAAMAKLKTGFRSKRAIAVDRLPEFDALRDRGQAMKNHVLANLDYYLERFAARVEEQGGQVHWCRTAGEARQVVLDICRGQGAKMVTKGKSMISEEIGLNDWLIKHGIETVETDLGEYIIQLRHEAPSHIIAPAIHVNRQQVADAFRAAHSDLDAARPLDEPRQLLDEARAMLRQKFLAADVGITGANFLVAENGATAIVTNEGNGDLTQILPKAHIVLASLEKIVPTMADAATVMRLLARSATGQEATSYVTFSAGPRRPNDKDGPKVFHVVLLDNGRSAMLGGPFQDMLRCIRCAACINHCPVYGAVGGHAYGSVYCGPMGSVLSPALGGLAEWAEMPNASTLCGRCEIVCPMRIPLPSMLRHWRTREFERHLTPLPVRAGLAAWGFLATKPGLYHLAMRLAMPVLAWFAKERGRLADLPLARGWTASRDLPAPEGETFQAAWARRKRP